jgi:hypothetical protein
MIRERLNSVFCEHFPLKRMLGLQFTAFQLKQRDSAAFPVQSFGEMKFRDVCRTNSCR